MFSLLARLGYSPRTKTTGVSRTVLPPPPPSPPPPLPPPPLPALLFAPPICGQALTSMFSHLSSPEITDDQALYTHCYTHCRLGLAVLKLAPGFPAKLPKVLELHLVLIYRRVLLFYTYLHNIYKLYLIE